MNSQGRIKTQHYVPHFYLKRFSINEKIFVFDKWDNKIFQTNINNVASENSFYDLPPRIAEEIESRQMVENYLSKIESQLALTFKELMKRIMFSSKHVLSKELKYNLASFLVLQQFRTKQAREFFLQLHSVQMKQIVNCHLEHTNPLLFNPDMNINIFKEDEALWHAQVFLNPEMLQTVSAFISNYIWLILSKNTSIPLLTSDNPVVLYSHRMTNPADHFGLIAEGIEIALPLTRKYLLVAIDPRHFASFSQKLKNIAPILNYNNIIFYNYLQIAESYRYVYSLDGGDEFSLVSDVISRQPDLRGIDRNLIRSNELKINKNEKLFSTYRTYDLSKILGNSFMANLY